MSNRFQNFFNPFVIEENKKMKNIIVKQLKSLITLLLKTTILEKTPVLSWSQQNYSLVYFPLVGFVVGLIAAIFCYINSILFNKTIAVTLALLLIVIITVANHEKEFFNSFNELEKSFFKFNNEIIAILLLFFVVIVKLMCVSSIPISELTMAFVLALTVSRWSVILLVYRYDYNLSGVENFNNKEQIMDEVKQVEKITTEQFIVATLLTLVPIILFFGLYYITIFVGTALLALGIGELYKKFLGSITWNSIGTLIQLSEITIFLLICAKLL